MEFAHTLFELLLTFLEFLAISKRYNSEYHNYRCLLISLNLYSFFAFFDRSYAFAFAYFVFALKFGVAVASAFAYVAFAFKFGVDVAFVFVNDVVVCVDVVVVLCGC